MAETGSLIPEIFPRAEADIIRQFRYYLVDKGDSAAAFRAGEQLRRDPDLNCLRCGDQPVPEVLDNRSLTVAAL
jgi:hypothetical protein